MYIDESIFVLMVNYMFVLGWGWIDIERRREGERERKHGRKHTHKRPTNKYFKDTHTQAEGDDNE